MGRSRKIDKVRASRDGHEFHEAWTARKATQLLWPDSELAAIAIEGLSPADQAGASTATVEIADLTFYFGGEPTFTEAARTTLAQVKYSIANQHKEFRATHAKKTIKKFSGAYREFKRKHGALAVEQKLRFQLITNQPIAEVLLQAIRATAKGLSCSGVVREQMRQIKAACGLSGKPLAEFARKLSLIGLSGSLPQTKDELASLLVDWSATNDPIADARLGRLRDLVREKAGYAGTNRNLIMRTDVLTALQIGDPKDLLPCASALIDVGEVLEREQLDEAMTRISANPAPLLIHASGGVGKTVFVDSLASKIAADREMVVFDCFGGGAYRSPEDARHLPKQGLIHIANTLAFRGLCDPMLPDSPDVVTLLRTFRRRLTQCVTTLSRRTPNRELAIFIDAIDNAVFAASQASEDCFPIGLLESLDAQPIDGVKLVVSCRTERIPKTFAKLDEFELLPFSKDETEAFLRARLKRVTAGEVNVAHARSGGNPRVLDYLLKAGRDLLGPSEIDKEIELDDLIQERITNALSSATQRGYEETDLFALLAGLAVLPPPVPVDEYAAAHGMGVAAIESFASDLSPLLERTNHGLMLRDEPTETLIHRRYATSRDVLERVASNLFARQDASVYAARALPRLLHKLDDGERLFALAFDDRIPTAITSTVGKRNVQYARLKAAAMHAAMKANYNQLVRLLLELSTIAAVDQRGTNYILGHPDLVVAAGDVDAQRRLFEIRTAWPGTRHGRLAIVNLLAGALEEAYRHISVDLEWIEHFRRDDHSKRTREEGPDQPDIAAVPFFLISVGRIEDASQYLHRWHEWYSFEACELVFGYSHLAQSLGSQSPGRLGAFVDAIRSIGPLAAALSFHEIPNAERKGLCVKLARLCARATNLYLPDNYGRQKEYRLEDGLRKSAALALSLGLNKEAQKISLRAPHDRPGTWAYRDRFSHAGVFPFVFRVALLAAARGSTIHEKDLLPKELVPICSRITRSTTGEAFREKAREKLSKVPRKPSYADGDTKQVAPTAMSYDEQQTAERFLSVRLEPLLVLSKALSAALGASPRTIDERFIELVETWEKVQKSRDRYSREGIDHFFRALGLDAVLFVFWVRAELGHHSVERMLTAVHTLNANASNLVRIVAVLSQREPLQSLAGEQAIKARALIEEEDEVIYRASLYGALGRALLQASIDEASVNFRDGLEQMDAIGSGDYEFTNELLLFASAIRGEELDERDFHTLSNICELNLGDEPEKFPWGAYGRGMAKVAGLRGLAKLSRWDDRDRVALNNTLLPYLTGLLEAGKIDPKDALCINRLANPVEYYYAGTKEFAEALREQAGPDAETITELITQFEDDNPTIAADETLRYLCAIAEEALSESHDLTKHLARARGRYDTAREGRDSSFVRARTDSDQKMRRDAAKRERENREALARIVAATDPTDEASFVEAINQFNGLDCLYDLKGGFFSALRKRVPFGARGQYVRIIANLEHLYFYWKLAELKDAREAWKGSSAALADVYESLAEPLILAHANDLGDDGRFSGWRIKEISEITGVSMVTLALDVIKVFSRPDSTVAGSVWLALASFVCPAADEGQGQVALQRLLSSESARLADSVPDGLWRRNCYPSTDFVDIASGLIWRVLGSPRAIDRWRAAHCIRRYAKFGRWEIVDRIVALSKTKSAAPFQAPELVFYHLHARLGLLIALARTAIDHPQEVAKYKDDLIAIALEQDEPHVLMRHFAAMTLLSCADQGHLTLDSDDLQAVRVADRSPHSRLPKGSRDRRDSYHGRPDSAPKPPFQFHLEYDFRKHDVDSLGRVFGKGCWELDDMLSEIVHAIDPAATSMYEDGGRESPWRHSYEMTTSFHSYGQQLGWHALFIAAGRLLATSPVTDGWFYEDDPWGEWLRRYGLTRKDGLWLSDGTDRTPDDDSVRLLEPNGGEHAITGDQAKILGLAGLHKGVKKELVIQGGWYSSDGIRIRISSALVPPNKAVQFARKLVRDEPTIVWLPVYQDGDEDEEIWIRSDLKGYSPWVVCQSGEVRLDEHDPYGVSVATFRPRLARAYSAFCRLTRQDGFGRQWSNNRGTIALRTEAWGRDESTRERGPHPGLRMFFRSSQLKRVLTEYDKELLVLVKLERYEKETYRRSGRYSHTVAVVRINKLLNLEYFRGRVNHLA